MAEMLLAHKSDVDLQDRNGATALQYDVRGGQERRTIATRARSLDRF